MDKILLVEVVAYAPTAYYHCTHCEVAFREMGVDNHLHDEQVQSSLPEDLTQEYQQLSDWVHVLFRRHCDKVIVKVIDAASLEGFWKTLRYGIHRYPAVIIDGSSRFDSRDYTAADLEIDRLLGESQPV